MLKYLQYTWIPLFISAIIFYLTCLIPVKDIPSIEFDFFIELDKIVHFCMFGGLSGATGLYYVYAKKGNINMPIMIIGAILIPILYGGLIEILQANFFAPRTGDWFDFLADALGSLVAFPIILVYRNYLLKKNRAI